MSAKRHLQRHVYAAIGAVVHFVMVKIFGEAMASGLLKIAESISKLRNNDRD